MLPMVAEFGFMWFPDVVFAILFRWRLLEIYTLCLPAQLVQVNSSVLRMCKRVKPLSFAPMFMEIHETLLSTTWAEKRNCRQRGYCVNLQVLILFHLADHLMKINCRKKVLPSTTIFCQLASYRHSNVNSRNVRSSLVILLHGCP